MSTTGGKDVEEATEGLRVGVVGLGSMGLGMATSLLRAGIETCGFDPSRDACERFVAAGGAVGEVGDLASTLDAVVIVVVNEAQTRAVLFGDDASDAAEGADGLAARLRPDTLVLGCATVPPAAAREFESRLAEHGVLYLDTPISGGSIKAAEGRLTIMASAVPEALERARPVLGAMAETVFTVGDAAGAGSAMKTVNQLLTGTHIVATAEAFALGISQGIEPARLFEVISRCAGTSWIFEDRGPHIVAGDYAPKSAVDIFVKDLGIVVDTARAARLSTPLAASAFQQFLAAAGSGLGAEDDAAVVKVYARLASLALPGDE